MKARMREYGAQDRWCLMQPGLATNLLPSLYRDQVGKVVMEVFEARVACYNADLARLDATRGMIG